MVKSVTTPRPGVQQPGQRRNRVLLLLVVLLILALLVALAAFGGYFWLTRQRSAEWTWQNPVAAVDITRVRPDFAVLTLAGMPSAAIAQEALASGEPDSALAALAYSTSLTDAERLGLLLPIAKHFEEINAFDLAALAYQQMHSLAALSTTLSDYARAQASLEAAQGFIRLDKATAAEPSLAQAETLARYSVLLAPVQRQEITLRLVQTYQQAGRERQADEVARLAADPRTLPDARHSPGPWLPGFQGQFLPPSPLVEAENARRQRAMDFLDAWDASEGKDVEAARAELAAALLQEDGVRQAVFATQIAEAASLADKAAVLRAKIDWLTVRLMIGRGAMGFDLVPEWRLAADRTADELVQAYDQLFKNYSDQVAALPNPDDIGLARVELMREQILRGRLGQIPDYPEENWAQQLREVQQSVQDRLPLLVIDEPWGGGKVFRLSESF